MENFAGSKVIRLENGLFLRVDFIAPSVFRIRLNSSEEFGEGALLRYSIAELPPGVFKHEIIPGKEITAFKTGEAVLEISSADGSAVLKDAAGEVITGQNAPPLAGDGFSVSFGLSPGERLYGLGDQTRDRIQKRGHAGDIIVKNVESYAPSPFMMSDRGWAVFLNTTWFHRFDAGAAESGALRFFGPRGGLDYFLFSGKGLPDLLFKYTGITGRPCLLPKWGYGLTFVCDERGVRARDVLNEAYEFRRHGIPCDVIGLEPGWMEKRYDYSVDKEWSKERFHIPEWLKGEDHGNFYAALKNMGFKMSLWLCCDYDLSEYEEMLVKEKSPEVESSGKESPAAGDIFRDEHFSAPVYMDNITKKGEPWFEHLKKFVDDGASAFKLDGALQVCFHPDRKWANGMDDAEMHNLYPVLYNKQMSLGYSEYTGKRAMIFSAGGYAGIQKYSATWAGDTGGGKEPLVSILNHGLSGHSNACADMEVYTDAGIHFGFLQPLSQVLSWHQYNQPWFLGRRRLELFKFYANLRYSLMPYIYSMAHFASRTGMPVARAMPLMFPDDPKCDEYIHQYMFGSSFLVSAFAEKVYLPSGRWVDYWTGRAFEGPAEIPAEFPEGRGGCLFVREGAIIPTREPGDFAGTETPERITWEVFPYAESSFEMIEDDGETFGYLEGQSAVTLAECGGGAGTALVKIHPRKGSYEGMPEKRVHDIRLHCSRAPASVENAPEWDYSEKDGIVSVRGINEGKKTNLIKVVF